MNKAAKYAINGALICGIGNALLNIIRQINRMNDKPEVKFNWKELLIASGKGAVVGGAAGGLIGAITDYQNSMEKPLNTDVLLLGFIDKIKLTKDDNTYQALSGKADYLINLLKEKFNGKLAGEPLKLGSTEKGTALRDNFDIDICLPFKPDSFRSTAEMYDSVLYCLEKHIGNKSIIKIRNQKKSFGVILELRGDKFKIDVVPYKITKGKSTSGYLYVNDKSFLNNSSFTKTDIHALKNVKLTETQKKLIIALKNWKINYNVPVSSHLIEHLVLDAYKYNHNNIPRSFTDKLILVFQHIENNLDIAVIRSVENTNNILTNISDFDKSAIISACKKVIEEYEYQPNSIIKFIN